MEEENDDGIEISTAVVLHEVRLYSIHNLGLLKIPHVPGFSP